MAWPQGVRNLVVSRGKPGPGRIGTIFLVHIRLGAANPEELDFLLSICDLMTLRVGVHFQARPPKTVSLYALRIKILTILFTIFANFFFVLYGLIALNDPGKNTVT